MVVGSHVFQAIGVDGEGNEIVGAGVTVEVVK